jgi:hypothetical protein
MIRRLIAVVAFSCALTASAAPTEVTFDPPAPDSDTSVIARVRGVMPIGCVPDGKIVTRSGQTIDVRWILGECISIGFGTLWVDSAPLGLLEPGTYTVRFFIDSEQFDTKTLVVTLGDAPITVVPPYASIRGGTRIFLSDDNCEVAITAVRIDGVAQALDPSGCGVSIIAPAHATGAVDVQVDTQNHGTVHLPAALHYLDPAAPVSPNVFERVLLPIVYNGPGAFGSQWVTEGEVESDLASFDWFHDFERSECAGTCSRPPAISDFLNHPNGMIVTVPHALSDHIAFTNLRVRDTSRTDSSWGTEVPVVRESEFRYELKFRNVPFDPRYRLTLRLYSMTGIDSFVQIFADGLPRPADLDGPCASAPCASALPSHAAIDLKKLFPEINGNTTIRISTALERMWGFITVTNNETQEVTVISPMR